MSRGPYLRGLEENPCLRLFWGKVFLSRGMRFIYGRGGQVSPKEKSKTLFRKG